MFRIVREHYFNPITINYDEKSRSPLGFPIPTVLILDHTGQLATYSPITNEFQTSLPGLKKLPKAPLADLTAHCSKWYVTDRNKLVS